MQFARAHVLIASSARFGRGVLALLLLCATLLAPFAPSVAIAQDTGAQDTVAQDTGAQDTVAQDTGVLPAAADIVFAPLEDVTSVAVGERHACALTTAGAVHCWGDNHRYQLANDPSLQIASIAISALELESGVKAIAAGDYFNCALMSSGAVKCWGDDESGQIGNGDGFVTFLPVFVNGLSGVTAISANGSTACAIAAAGALWCWGANGSGQIGDGTQDERTEPVAVAFPPATVVTRVSVGQNHVCAITSTGALYCWGANESGQLGDNSTDLRLAPVAVSGMGSGVTVIGAGAAHTCAVAAGTLKCWGNGDNGKIGDGSTGVNRLTPVPVSGSLAVVEIALGNEHSCVRTATGAAYCWGSDESSQIGDAAEGTVQPEPVPVADSASGVMAIAANADTNCSARSTGRATCWGLSNVGNLGNPDYPEFAETPVFVITVEPCFILDVFGGPGGTKPTVSPVSGFDCDENNYRKGDVITITAHPGFKSFVQSWSGVDPADNVPGNSTATLIMPAADHEVSAVYDSCHHLEVTTIGRTGSEIDDPVLATPLFPACGDFWYPADTVVTLDADPKANERVVSWTGVDGFPAPGVSVVTVTMPADDRQVTVTYARNDRVYLPNARK